VINCVRPAGGPDTGTRLRVLVMVVVVACGTTMGSMGIDVELVIAALTAFAAVGVAVGRELISAPSGEAA
jgi:hypothetical protein